MKRMLATYVFCFIQGNQDDAVSLTVKNIILFLLTQAVLFAVGILLKKNIFILGTVLTPERLLNLLTCFVVGVFILELFLIRCFIKKQLKLLKR